MSKSTSNFFKIVAMITMLIDHVGYLFFPNIIMFRIIGRIAFPLFAYLLVTGFLHTKNINNYLIRLGIFAIISQLPYSFLVPGRYNVILLFFIALLSLKYQHRSKILIPIITAAIAEYFKISYGMYGIFIIYLFYYLYKDKKKLSLSFVLINILFTIATNNTVQFFSFLALPFLFINLEHIEIKVNKYVAYVFYPLHISILLIIKHYGLL